MYARHDDRAHDGQLTTPPWQNVSDVANKVSAYNSLINIRWSATFCYLPCRAFFSWRSINYLYANLILYMYVFGQRKKTNLLTYYYRSDYTLSNVYAIMIGVNEHYPFPPWTFHHWIKICPLLKQGCQSKKQKQTKQKQTNKKTTKQNKKQQNGKQRRTWRDGSFLSLSTLFAQVSALVYMNQRSNDNCRLIFYWLHCKRWTLSVTLSTI